MENQPHDYAGFWPRFAAYTIDGAIMALFMNAVYWSGHQWFSGYIDSHPELVKFLTKETSEYSADYKAVNNFMWYCTLIQNALIAWCYYAGMESSPMRGTIGKWALGIYVTDLEGNRVSFVQATGRFFGKMISGLLLGIGYLMAGITDRKQAMHDKMADCLVMRK